MIRRKRSFSLDGIASLIMARNNIIAILLEIASVHMQSERAKQKCLFLYGSFYSRLDYFCCIINR